MHKKKATQIKQTLWHRHLITWRLQFTLGAGQVIQTEVHKQNVTQIRYYGSDAKEPAETLV